MGTNLSKPTVSELAILGALWERGEATVRQVHEALADPRRPTGYTTTLKLMQIMTEKGILARDESQRTHVYRSRVPKEKTQRQLVGDLLDRAFGGSMPGLVMQALSARRTSPEEIAQIRKMLEELEGDGRQ
jgi:predicted transcriptional regulator